MFKDIIIQPQAQIQGYNLGSVQGTWCSPRFFYCSHFIDCVCLDPHPNLFALEGPTQSTSAVGGK